MLNSRIKLQILFISFIGIYLISCSVKPNIEFTYNGFNTMTIECQQPTGGLTVKRIMLDSIKESYGITDLDSFAVFQWADDQIQVLDSVPVSFGEMTYRYIIENKDRDTLYSFQTNKYQFPKELIPTIKIQEKPGWETIYIKAWNLCWQRIRTSKALPSRFAYNDYPDNNNTYVWDAAFCNLYQAYSEVHGGHPGILTYDGFYHISQNYNNGYIPRRFNINNLKPATRREDQPGERGTNPPLFGLAEWNHFLMTNDTLRLKRILPFLCKNFDFIEGEMQEKPGRYIWGGNGSGWDNIDRGVEGEKLKYWVEMPALQALAAKYIVDIGMVVGNQDVVREYALKREEKKRQIEQFWNEEQGWFCGLSKDNQFTRKTLQGIWPLMAGLVDSVRTKRMVENLLDNNKFNTSPMPLPTLARDEPGYNPKGEYWLGSVWINMSLITIRALRQNGYPDLATEFASRTLDGIYAVYRSWEDYPETLWECYSPEFNAPASHKKAYPEVLGTVRSEFGGWTGCLINLLIEEVLGISVNAPENTIYWGNQLKEDFELNNLKFGNITTSISVRREGQKMVVLIDSDKPYIFNINGKEYNILDNELNRITVY